MTSRDVKNPQVYSNCYKKFLVEELVFLDNYLDYHYGNCAVIGRISKEENGCFLENIRLSCLGKENELPEGSIKIRLITNLYKDTIPSDKIAEIHGKAVFSDINYINNKIPITTQDLYYQFNEFLISNKLGEDEKDLEDLKQIFNQSLLDKYEPAIQVRFINLCDQAEELIEYNLEIRLLTN